MKYCAVYITAKDRKEAEKISDMLLKERLIACSNIMPIHSSYWWKGRIERSKEFLLLGKTTKRNAKKIIKCVRKIHSYKVPCINFLPIIDGNPDYLTWIEKETA